MHAACEHGLCASFPPCFCACACRLVSVVCDKRDFICATDPLTCSYGGVCGAGILPLDLSQLGKIRQPPPRQPVLRLHGPDRIDIRQFDPYDRCPGPLTRFCDLGATAIDAYDMSDITPMVVACADKAPTGSVSILVCMCTLLECKPDLCNGVSQSQDCVRLCNRACPSLVRLRP